jgi:cell division transport system permease protein
VHREVIEVLHLIGARDSYVAGQFERHALVLGLRGAALGFGLAVATLFGLGGAAAAIEAPLLPAFAFEAWGWGALGALPLAMALVVMATARLTVLRALARMP